MLNQRLQQKLLQKLSPQQILLMKLLQIPTIGLEQRIKQEIEDNPALEIDGEEMSDYDSEDTPESSDEGDDYAETSIDDYQEKDPEFDLNDYMTDDDIPSYKLQTNNYSSDEERKEIPFASGITFHELLEEQLRQQYLDERNLQIGLYIIGNIDDSGYLQRSIEAIIDDLAFSQNVMAEKEEVEHILTIIQEFDPSGVGARSLKECLLIQLQRKSREFPSEAIDLAIRILNRSFIDFTKKHYQKITKRLEISEDQLKKGIEEILRLNPKPGNSLSETAKTNHYIIPDFNISNNGGVLELTLNSWNNPDLRVSHSYANMIHSLGDQKKSKQQKEALVFIKQKVDSARWFIDAIKQRQNTLT